MAYTKTEAKELVIKAGKELVKAGLIARTWGNISARISDTQFVITPSGRAYETLTPDELVTVSIADCSYEGTIKPSSEKGVHADAYRLRPEVNFVIHTHQVNASALSILGQDITEIDSYGETYKQILGDVIPCAKYGMSSTKKLKNAVSFAVSKYPASKAVLMKYHGALCMGKDYDDAFLVAHSLEEVCGKLYEKFCKNEAKDDTIAVDYGSSMRSGSKVSLKVDGKMTDYDLEHLSQDISEVFSLHAEIYKDDNINSIIHVTTPYVLEMSRRKKMMKPYLDDQAQIAGTSVKCLKKDQLSAKTIIKGLKKRNALLISDAGAICTGGTKSDAEAVGLVLEKGCKSALLSYYLNHVKPVKTLHAFIERKVYVLKYSKLKK